MEDLPFAPQLPVGTAIAINIAVPEAVTVRI
jgi:hypothetical protein